MARLPRLARRLAPHLGRIGARVGPAARLARVDMGLARAWAVQRRAVLAELGDASERAYTELIVRVAPAHLGVARLLVHDLPVQLARADPADRGRLLALLAAVARDRPEALPSVARSLPDLLSKMEDTALVRYLSRAVELHGESVARADSFLRMESGEARDVAARMQRGVGLDGVRRTLTMYARAHCGADVQVRAGAQGAYTDGRHIYLPDRVDRFGDDRDFLVYRVLTARAAGYLEFGSLELDLDAVPGDWAAREDGELELERLLRSFPNASIARDLFDVLEAARVEARVRSEYPGIARDMNTLTDAWRAPRPDAAGMAPIERVVERIARLAWGAPLDGLPSEDALTEAERRAVDQAVSGLARVRADGATVLDTVDALGQCYLPVDALLLRVDPDALERINPDEIPAGDGGGRSGGDRPDPGEAASLDRQAGYRGLESDSDSAALRVERMAPEEREVEARAVQLLHALKEADDAATLEDARERARRDVSYEEMADMLDRMSAPAGPAQEAHTEPSGEMTGAVRGSRLEVDAERTGEVRLYPEWDATIEDHKPDWVKLTEYRLQPGSGDFVDRVRREYGPLIGRVRRAFEALRPEAVRRVRGLPDGEEIDIDRAIAARVERRVGGTPSDRIYMRRLREERDVAVAFLVDMSSSTNEAVPPGEKRVIDIEKEALVLIAEAVDAIGDRCAIWGFSGYGRDQVAFYVAKEFDDAWDDRVRERVGRISWKMENRDGAAIRHATYKLSKVPARVRLLLLLSDGKPLDCGCDHYSDRYAQEDTRAALAEARAAGVHPFCITVDPHGRGYLERMYGEGGYTVIDRVERLPERLPLIYRRLTR